MDEYKCYVYKSEFNKYNTLDNKKIFRQKIFS